MHRGAWLLTALLAAACGQVAAQEGGTATAAEGYDPFAAVADAPTNRGLKPVRWYVCGRMHYYQVPPDAVGTLVTFHGCGRYAKAFFPWDPEDCEECLGFPEHVAQTKQALALGYAVLALEPIDSRHLCWSSSSHGYFQNDQANATELIRTFVGSQGLAEKPIFLLGTSSGGTLALKLAASLERQAEARAGRGKEGEEKGEMQQEKEWLPRISGVISEEAVATNFGAADSNGRLRYPAFPPTIFVLMEGGNSQLDAPQVVKMLQDGGVPSAVVMSPPRRVTPTFLSDRIPAITPLQSELIAAGMHQIGMLDADGWLLGDPERNRNVRKNISSPAFDWYIKLKALLPWLADDSPTLSLVYRRCGIQQALNVAYGRHDAVSDYVTVALKWLESRGRADLDSLLEQYTVKDFNLTALNVAERLTVDSGPGSNTVQAEGPSPQSSLGSNAAAAESEQRRWLQRLHA